MMVNETVCPCNPGRHIRSPWKQLGRLSRQPHWNCYPEWIKFEQGEFLVGWGHGEAFRAFLRSQDVDELDIAHGPHSSNYRFSFVILPHVYIIAALIFIHRRKPAHLPSLFSTTLNLVKWSNQVSHPRRFRASYAHQNGQKGSGTLGAGICREAPTTVGNTLLCF